MHKKAADVPNMPFCSSLSYFFRHVNYNRGSQSEFRRTINQQIKFDGYFLFSWCLPSDDNKKLNTATIADCHVLLNYNQWFSDSEHVAYCNYQNWKGCSTIFHIGVLRLSQVITRKISEEISARGTFAHCKREMILSSNWELRRGSWLLIYILNLQRLPCT